MPSSMPREALPVRSVVNSFLTASSALFIFSSAFFLVSLTIVPPGYQRSYRFALHDAFDVAGDVQVKYDDGKVVVHAQGDGGGVHDAEVFLEHFNIGKAVVLLRRFVLHGVGAENTVDLGGLHDHVRPDLLGPEDRK